MKLKLWEKSFLLTFVVFFVLLNICLVVWCLSAMKNSYGDFIDSCVQESESIMLMEKHIGDGTTGKEELEHMADAYAERETYIRLYDGSEMLIDRLPEGIEEDLYMGRVEAQGHDYYYIDSVYGDFRLIYMRTMEGIYGEQINTIIWLLFIDIVLATVTGMLLYMAMKRIYRPVSNISHELRTPLTSILGYGQLLSMDNMEDEDRALAGKRIEKEARYMKDIVEKLLTVESLRGSTIKKREISLDGLVADFQDRYKTVDFENHIHVIHGDESLVRILLTNLMENAVREDAEACFIAEGNVIRVINRAPGLTVEDVRNMNIGARLGDDKVRGHGIGLELCAEIVKAHGWQMRYELTEGMLNAIVVIK